MRESSDTRHAESLTEKEEARERSHDGDGGPPRERPRDADLTDARAVDESSSQAPLFPSEDHERFRAHWKDIQTNFVDDPRRSVEQADALVGEITDRLTSVFARNRDDLERQWTAGEDVSTEELRRTLRQYRAFFERLLSL